MTIPLAIFYYIYLIFVLGFLVFTVFNVYHLVRFGYLTFTNITIIVFYIVVSILILSISWRYTSAIDWQQSFELIPTFPF